MISRINTPNLKGLYKIITELSKFKKLMGKNENSCTLCYLYFQVPYKGYHSIAEIFSFNLVCSMSKLSNQQPRYQRKRTTRATWHPDHRCLSLRDIPYISKDGDNDKSIIQRE